MRQAKTLNVSLTTQLGAFVTDQVDSGRFGSASEVVRAALGAFERQEEAEKSLARLPRGRES